MTRPAATSRVLDADAIERVRDEERPDPRDADELHDALLTRWISRNRGGRHPEGPPEARTPPMDAAAGCRPCGVAGREWSRDARQWIVGRCGTVAGIPRGPSRRDPRAEHRQRSIIRAARAWTRGSGDRRAVARAPLDRRPNDGRSARRFLGDCCDDEADAALLALESEGAVLRGHFSPGGRTRSASARMV